MANIIAAPTENRTGYKMGTLSAVIYFEKADGSIVPVHGCPIEKHILIPPSEIGDGGRLARMLWEQKYKAMGYAWCEAGTFKEVQELQRKLVVQEMKVNHHMGSYDHEVRKRVHAKVAESLRQRMASSSCSPWERDFIKAWLDLREDKQDEYTRKWEQKQYYLQCVEFDSTHKLEDRLGTL